MPLLLAGLSPYPPTALRPDPGPARDLLTRELSRPEYQPSLLERVLGWIGDLVDALLTSAGQASVPGVVTAVLVVVVLALVVGLTARLRHEGSTGEPPPALLGAGPADPERHRARARSALEGGRPDEALVEAFRALAVRSVRRALVEDRPGTTAHELAALLVAAFPSRADDLRAAADRFDDVFYGGRDAAAADAEAVLGLDVTLRDTSPARDASAAGPLPTAAPR